MTTPKDRYEGHTEGPWIAKEPRGQQHAIDRKWEIVAPIPKGGGEMVIVGEHTGIDCLTEANARLMADSPELLRQNRELRRALAAVVDSDSDVLLRGAIADAKDTLESCKEL